MHINTHMNMYMYIYMNMCVCISGYIALVEEDFEWITNNLIRIANSCCEGRVVSALEGGYQIGKNIFICIYKHIHMY
jgi:acetoin utilization deacetylase AcuC-like enzyme